MRYRWIENSRSTGNRFSLAWQSRAPCFLFDCSKSVVVAWLVVVVVVAWLVVVVVVAWLVVVVVLAWLVVALGLGGGEECPKALQPRSKSIAGWPEES